MSLVWSANCTALCCRWSIDNDLEGLRKPRNDGEPMSQESNWRPIDQYSESLHASEVVNARELKFCEGCGVLLVRVRGSKAQLCSECDQAMATAMERTQ